MIVRYSPDAREDLLRIDKVIAKRISKKIRWYSSQSNPLLGADKLNTPFSDFHKYRVGDWRIFARLDVNSGTLIVHRIKHRREAYRN